MKTIDATKCSYSGRLYAEEVLTRGWVSDLQGGRQPIHAPVSAAEARFLAGLILETGVKQSLETGVALGVSTLAIT